MVTAGFRIAPALVREALAAVASTCAIRRSLTHSRGNGILRCRGVPTDRFGALMKIFLSCVSAQFGDCRDEIASDLRTIGNIVRVQEDFQQGPRSLIEQLEAYIVECDRVIALVGNAFGSKASGATVPLVDPPRSFTQWEYFFTMGERLDGSRAQRKPLYIYLASDTFLTEHPTQQDAADRDWQRTFAEFVKATGEHWSSFDTRDQLCRLVLRDGWQLHERPPRKPRNLPYDSLGDLFKGRDTFLNELRQRLPNDKLHAAVITSKQAVHGLGGVGKTRLAVEYAIQNQDAYSALLFVVGESSEALRRNFAALCGPQILNLPEANANDENLRVAATVRWLQEHPGWLLILDNVDTLAAATEVETLLPTLAGGHVLITSRISEWNKTVRSFELDVLREDDAVAFLLAKTHGQRRGRSTDETDARILARELDGLALAVEQAGAFIGKLHVSIADYLRRWRERETKVREWHDARLMQYPRSVAIAWDATFQQLDTTAQVLLQILSWCAPESIPRRVLEIDGLRKAVGVLVLRLDSIDNTTGYCLADIESAISTLAGFSLVKWAPDHDGVRIHRLVQQVTRERIPTSLRDDCLNIALAMLNDSLRDVTCHETGSLSPNQQLRPHIIAVADAEIESLKRLLRGRH